MWETISSKDMCYIRMYNAKAFSKFGNSHLPLQVKKLRQKGNVFSKKFSVNSSPKSLLLPYLPDEKWDLLCLKLHLTEKRHWCLLSGVGTRLKVPFLPGWVEHRAFELHVCCLLGLAMASEGVQPTNSPCPAVAQNWCDLVTTHTCSQPWAAEVEGLQSCLCLSCCKWGALLQALCECCGDSETSGQS